MWIFGLKWLTQPRSQSFSAISDVTSPVKLVGKIRRGLYRTRFQGSSVTRVARTRLGTRLGLTVNYTAVTQSL